MKKTLTALLLATSLTGFAKNKNRAFPTGSITVSVGTAIPNYLGLITDVAGVGGGKSGPYQVGVQYQANNKWALGAVFSTCSATTASETYSDYTGYNFNYRYKLGLTTFMVGADYYWKHNKKMALYSGLAIGVGRVKASAIFSDNQDHSGLVSFSALGSGMAYQLTAFGVRADLYKGIGAYGNIGFGLNGIIGLGIQYTIKH